MDSGPLTITAAAARIRRGELTPSDLLEQCLARVDRYEEKVRAWAYLDRERARRDAERLTDELKRGQDRGPLHGIPVGVKDIIDVFDMPTGCGSKLWANSYARKDATCVERLRQAGAVILGKTVTTAYASFDPPVTRNPWNLGRTPGGSSSGSAAAVACGMCLAALATQTGGSITRPASYCGVCSLKPSLGPDYEDGVLPLAPGMDHVGVMANCVRDLFLVFRYMVRRNLYSDVEERICPFLDRLPSPDADWLPTDHLRPIKLFVTPDFSLAPCDSTIRQVFGDVVTAKLMDTDSGFEFWRTELPPWYSRVPELHRTVMAVKAATVHQDRLRRHPDDYPPRITELIEEGLQCEATRYAEAEEYRRWQRSDEVGACFQHGVLFGPATTTPPTSETTGDPLLNSPWSFFGFPTVSVPIGWTADGLPVAAQVVSPSRYKNLRPLVVADALESRVGFSRRLPPVP